MTTTGMVHDWLQAIAEGGVEYRNGLFHGPAGTVEHGSRDDRLLRDFAVSGWTAVSGGAVTLTATGRAELGSPR